MAPLNVGNSFAHHIGAIYLRDVTGNLITIEGKASAQVQQNWSRISRKILTTSMSKSIALEGDLSPVEIREFTFRLTRVGNTVDTVRQHTRVCEVYDREQQLVRGLMTFDKAEDALSDWAELFFLLSTHIQPFRPISCGENPEAARLSYQIADIFDQKLRNTPKEDEWMPTGRDYFINRIFGFVDRGVPIEFCLPAFPCKSPNKNKVGGNNPDRAENIAMRVVHDFLKEVESIYEPGATLLIISDGHVFSDCIGVDDDTVSDYDEKLKRFYPKAAQPENGHPLFKFKGLEKILFSNEDVANRFEPEMLRDHPLEHPVETGRDDTADMSRAILMAVCGIEKDHFRSLVDQHDPNVTSLYRGHSRFLLEDLAMHASCCKQSVSKRKKTAGKVAAEMILRNQAYSNLVENIFPSHVRLSIHAHSNSGPKFGIRLFPRRAVRPIDSLDQRNEPRSLTEFQIPTPWHNSIIRVKGDKTSYLAHSGVAKSALEAGTFKGGWVNNPKGGYYLLQKVDFSSGEDD